MERHVRAFGIDAEGPTQGFFRGGSIFPLPRDMDLAGFPAEGAIDFPAQLRCGGVKNGGDRSKTTDFHVQAGGIDIASIGEVGGDGWQALLDHGAGFGADGIGEGLGRGETDRGSGDPAGTKAGGQIEDGIVSSKNDVAGKLQVIAIASDFTREHREEVAIAQFVSDRVHFLSVEAARIGVGGDLGVEVFVEEMLGFSELRAEERLVVRRSLFAMGFDGGGVGVGDGVGAKFRAVFLHLFDHRGGQRFAAAIDVVFVEEEGEGILEFFEDGVGVGVDGFPAVIDGDDGALLGDGFLPLAPSDEVGHRNHGDAEILKCLHLLAEFGGPNAHFRFRFGLGKIMITEDGNPDSVVARGSRGGGRDSGAEKEAQEKDEDAWHRRERASGRGFAKGRNCRKGRREIAL